MFAQQSHAPNALWMTKISVDLVASNRAFVHKIYNFSNIFWNRRNTCFNVETI